MLLIVEGIDRVGKTTLCKKLEEELGFFIYKDPRFLDFKEATSKQAQLVMVDKMRSILYAIENLAYSENIVLDRFHLTELVYGILDRECDVRDSIKYFDKIDVLSSLLGFKMFLVLPVDLERSSKEHGSDLTLHDTLFRKTFEMSRLDKQCVNYDFINDLSAKELLKYF